MDSFTIPPDQVIDFLGCIPILQQLPTTSIQQIAQSIQARSFAPGDVIVQEGEKSEGLYFIWKGEAEVSSFTEDSTVGATEPSLKRGDYFGHATVSTVKDTHKADVIAKTEVICLILGHEKANLLAPLSTWSLEKDEGGLAIIEQVLQLENLGVDLYRGITLQEVVALRQVYGGQLLGQALAAASKSVDPALFVHSLHSYFIRTGDKNVPIIYQVQRLRDGHSFATRSITASQHGQTIFYMLASFQRTEVGFTHQDPMPPAPDPEKAISVDEVLRSYRSDPRIPVKFRNKLRRKDMFPEPLDIRLCDPEDEVKPTALEPRERYWFRSREKLSEDQALQRCVAAYASDYRFLQISLRPHRGAVGVRHDTSTLHKYLIVVDPQLGQSSVIGCQAVAEHLLMKSMWFHKPFRADEWLLYVVDSPCASNGRGLVLGKMFTRNGEMVVSTAQEGVIRKLDKSRLKPKSKL